MKKTWVVYAVLASLASTAWGEADLNPGIFNTPPPTTTTSTPTPTTPAPRPTTTTTTTTTGGGSGGTGATRETPQGGSTINPAADRGRQSQNSGAGTNTMVGTALMATGAALMSNPPTVAPGAALMAMGVLAMMQAKEDKAAANASGLTFDASQYDPGNLGQNPTGTSSTTTTNGGDTPGSGDTGFLDKKIADATNKLGEAGYKISEKGLTHPDGSFTPAQAFNSPSSMAAAGLDPQAISAAQQTLASVDPGADGPKVSGVGVNSGGGGGGEGSSISEGEGEGSGLAAGAFGNPFNVNADKKASLVAGKTVMFDGEPIGVRGQNIFDMVHNCYQKKRAGNHFIESEHDVSARAPASNARRLPKK